MPKLSSWRTMWRCYPQSIGAAMYNVHGAVVYYLAKDHNKLYILTRSETAKSRDILANQQVALTIFDTDPPRTLQLQGIAQIENDAKVRDEIFGEMIQPRLYQGGLKAPPVTQYKAGGYMVVAISPTSAVYHPYQLPKEEA